MTAEAAGRIEVGEVAETFRFDESRLEAYMREHVAGFHGPLSVRQFTGGQSNPTYLLATPAAEYVLRRKPPGQLLSSAHAIDREYRVMSALAAHTRVPVPRTFALSTDESVIGTAFFIMERVRGRIFWDVALPDIPPAERPAYFDAMNATLAELHQVDFASVGLQDYGKSADYVRRQIKRWTGQYVAEPAAGRVEAMDRLTEWLACHIPASSDAALVHGDFRCDNLVFHPREPRVIAILDWELSTLGDPLADFAYHLMMYHLPTLAIPGLLGLDLTALNIPPLPNYVAAYCRRTGRPRIEGLNFYLAFNLFRYAAICHGIRGRMVRGTAVSTRAREYASGVERIAELGWRLAQELGD